MKIKWMVFIMMPVWFVINDGLFALATAAESKRLQEIIEGARREKQLNLRIITGMGSQGEMELITAFKKHFNLDIKMNVDNSGGEPLHFSKAISETAMGVPPSFDLLQGGATHVQLLKESGGAEQVRGWEALLAEIAPEAYRVRDKVSPSVLAGYGFAWATRLYGLVYNTRLISKQELPKTHKDLGNPKYKGAFPVSPWIDHAQLGILHYDRGEWLEIMRSWGRMKSQVLTFVAGVQQVVLGEFKFVQAQTYDYAREKARDPNVPLALTFFEDFAPMSLASYAMQKGARHPNAATLFMLWATSAEANRIFEKYIFYPNILIATGNVSRETLKMLQERNIRVSSWFDSPQGLEKLRWLQGTEEGKRYNQALATAQRDGR